MQGPKLLVPRLKDVLQELHDSPGPHVPNPPFCKKRASVAVVLRVRPAVPDVGTCDHHAISSTNTPFINALDNFFGQDWVQKGDPDVLFIKRAARVGDRWTGHIALPGGKRELSDADDQATGIRETKEEVGLDLGADYCLFIGKLPERVITTNWGKVPIMVLCPFVYLMLRHNIPPLTLQPTEVHSTHWVPIRGLLSPALRSTVRADVSDRLKVQKGSGIKNVVRVAVGQLIFCATVLTPSESLYCTSAPGFIPTANYRPCAMLGLFGSVGLGHLVCKKEPRDVDGPYLLWGLTLGILADLLYHIDCEATSTLWSWPTFSHWDIRFILWILTNRLRSEMSHEVNQQDAANEKPGTAMKINGIDHVTFTTSPWKSSLAAAHLPDEYFKLMRQSVVFAFIIRSNLFAILVAFLVLKSRQQNQRF